jgi:putative membrane protein
MTKNAIRLGLAAGVAGALVLLGPARAQQGSSGSAGSGTSDTASGGAGASASSGSTIAGAPSAGRKLDEKLQGQLEKIHAANQWQLKLAKLGVQNAHAPNVKQFAGQVQGERDLLDRQLTGQARTIGVSLEGKTYQKEVQRASKGLQKLQSRTGKDFDKVFMSQVVKDHQRDVEDLDDAARYAQRGHQAELAALLQASQSRVQGSLDQAKQLQKSLDQPAQPQGTGSATTSGAAAGPSPQPAAGGSPQPGGARTPPP